VNLGDRGRGHSRGKIAEHLAARPAELGFNLMHRLICGKSRQLIL